MKKTKTKNRKKIECYRLRGEVGGWKSTCTEYLLCARHIASALHVWSQIALRRCPQEGQHHPISHVGNWGLEKVRGLLGISEGRSSRTRSLSWCGDKNHWVGENLWVTLREVSLRAVYNIIIPFTTYWTRTMRQALLIHLHLETSQSPWEVLFLF